MAAEMFPDGPRAQGKGGNRRPVAMPTSSETYARGMAERPLRGLTPFSLRAPPATQPVIRASDLALSMIRSGHFRAAALVPALAPPPKSAPARQQLPLDLQTLPEAEMLALAAEHFGAPLIDLQLPAANRALIDRLGARECLRRSVLPLHQAGAVTLVASARPGEFASHRAWLEDRLGPVSMALAPAASIEAAILQRRGAQLTLEAETRVAATESCRDWDSPERRAWSWVLAFAAVLAAVLAPGLLWLALLGLALLTLLAASLLKLIAVMAALRRWPDASALDPVPGDPPPVLPIISIIVALYHESDIAPRLIKRLSRLEYPRESLEILLVVEQDDLATRHALAAAALPRWMRVITAGDGRIRTKPRALNIALDQCRGSIIGVYDAEDAPEPDQLRKVADRFQHAPASVACLQGMLDYYNPDTNWFSRCFTLEYASWFRLILPGVARLGLAVPLGGTTLFFRRSALEDLGAWDAHNVTEDADLGLRLFRHGHRTELLATTTREEANCGSVMAWIRQRSRWSKGYMMTWMVHMRHPWRLWRQIGPRAFIGFQIMLLGSCLQTLLAPLLWSYWLLSLALPVPAQGFVPAAALPFMLILFMLALVLDTAVAILGLRQSGHRIHPLWCLTLPAYFPFATLAAYKAVWELAVRPFYWDKTLHGVFDPNEAASPAPDQSTTAATATAE